VSGWCGVGWVGRADGDCEGPLQLPCCEEWLLLEGAGEGALAARMILRGGGGGKKEREAGSV
jgi:hypothetical protein